MPQVGTCGDADLRDGSRRRGVVPFGRPEQELPCRTESIPGICCRRASRTVKAASRKHTPTPPQPEQPLTQLVRCEGDHVSCTRERRLPVGVVFLHCPLFASPARATADTVGPVGGDHVSYTRERRREELCLAATATLPIAIVSPSLQAPSPVRLNRSGETICWTAASRQQRLAALAGRLKCPWPDYYCLLPVSDLPWLTAGAAVDFRCLRGLTPPRRKGAPPRSTKTQMTTAIPFQLFATGGDPW